MDDARTGEPAGKKLELTITTPRGVKFAELADRIVMRAIDGELGVLPGHAPLFTVLGDGVLRIYNDGVEKKLAVFGGTAEIENNQVRILSTIAQSPDEIDLGRAEEDRREAEEALKEGKEEQLSRQLQIMQTRALVRIHVSETEDYFADSSGENGD